MDGTFSAKAAALGYAYQFRYSLLVGLRRYKDSLDWQVWLETADDVEVSGTDDHALLQLKHRSQAATLTDSSADLWKTLRVWSEAVATGQVDPDVTDFVLVTTAGASPASAASMLGADRALRDPGAALDRLLDAANTSSNAALKAAFETFRDLTPEQQLSMLTSTTVVTGEGNISQIDDELRSECALAARHGQVDGFVERLEGWWFRRCLRQLADQGTEGITASEFDAFFSELRDSFRNSNLPVDWLELDLLAHDDETTWTRVFVKQLELLAIAEPRIGFAVRDYLRAFTQRSRWTRDGLLVVGELQAYERRLVEEWEIVFERMRDDLGDEATESQKVEAAKELYAWVESAADFPIRPECRDLFLTRGSYQMLADIRSVGWHPDFVVRLASLLEPVAGPS